MSQTPQKSVQKMCKSPKNSNFQVKQEKIDYEHLSTNCTVVGSNNLNLVKKPQILTSMSPAYSNPSPSYPQSPYSSPASLKSPSPSLKPPTPQPNFPVMQIIHNNLIGRPIQTSQPQNIIKLKPHLNILPKPSASPQPSPKPSVSPQIVIPTNQPAATIMPTAQPLLLNQMPMLTAPGVQFILRPQTATKLPTQMPTATATPQGLILQPGGQQLLQLQPPRSQPMVRVLTNGMQIAPSTTTFVTQMANQQPTSVTHVNHNIINNTHHHQQHQQLLQQQIHHVAIKKKPKTKAKKKLDLANIMKLSGIGDEDDIQFESDTSQSESEHNSVPTTPQPHIHTSQPTLVQTSNAHTNFVHTDAKKNIQNIQISAMAQPTINAATPVVQVLNQNFQSGMISNSTSQAAAAQASIPFNSFITPNVTINNGLMLQRFGGGFKLTVGEDGRLVLQHDPTINQELQSQLILQSLLGLNNGLVLQPSMDQQTVQQTVQTIQQQSVQTIQQQTVQSQTIQTVQQQTVQPQVQHTIQSLQPQIQQQTVQQTIQHQTVNALQQPMQIVQPQPIQSLHQQVQPTMHSISQSQVHSLQSQIQSLLQQQNHALQTQAVHQPQNVHSQAIQSVQNIAAQNVQNISAQNVQSIAAQNLQNIAAQNVQNITAQNLQNIAAQNVQNIASQNVQNIAAQNVQNIAAQNVQNIAAQNVQNIAAQNVQNISTQNVQNIAAQNVQNIAAQNVQNIAQSVQNIAAQNVQNIASAQNIQNISQNVVTQGMANIQPAPVHTVHGVQGFQQAHTQATQPILKVQPFQKSAPPVQTVQPIQQQHQVNQQNNSNDNGQHQNQTNNPPTSYVVNLTPEQLERLKRNGQLTVNGQTIFMQRPNKDLNNDKKLSPKTKPVKKLQKIQSEKVQQRALLQENVNDSVKTSKITEQIKVQTKQTLVNTLNASPKHVLPQNHVQPIQNKPIQPQALVQPSVQPPIKIERQKSPVSPPKQQKVSPTIHALQDSSTSTTNHEVDKLLGQIIEETNNTISNNSNNHTIERQPQQRITTIQLTPQKQQHLKNIQLQIQALSARGTPGDADVQKTLKLLFEEQQKILASGKLLPPDKVYYHNNQLTIVNPSSLNMPSPGQIKSEPQSPVLTSRSESIVPRTTVVETQTTSSTQPITTQSPQISRVSVSTSTGDHATQTTTHHHTVHHHEIQRPPQSPQQTIHHHPNHQNIHNSLQNIHHIAAAQQHSQANNAAHYTPHHVPNIHVAATQVNQAAHASAQATYSNTVHHTVPNVVLNQRPSNVPTQQPMVATTSGIKQQHHQHYHQAQQHIPQHPPSVHQQQVNIAQQYQQQQQQQFHSLAKKAHLIETQLNLDQNGAIKPDIHTPFRDKKDACIRLIRYHCMDQPVLSEKDLDKADEIFELTARHFIGKFDKMVDKYKYLLMKESMRQVQTSELMMLDRMFLADEQQSLLKLRQDYENELLNIPSNIPESSGQGTSNLQEMHADLTDDPDSTPHGLNEHQTSEEYDEWACIQRELGCLPDKHPDDSIPKSSETVGQYQNNTHVTSLSHHASTSSHHNLKRTSSSDSRLETLKRFRVEKHTKKSDCVNSVQINSNNCSSGVSISAQMKCSNANSEVNSSSSIANSSYGSSGHEESENNSIDEQVQSAIDSILNLQQNTALDLDSILS